MYNVKKLYRPSTLEDALKILKEVPGAIPLAGGTDVIVKIRRDRPEDVILVSLEEIQDLKKIEMEPDRTIRIGSGITFTDLATDLRIAEILPCLKSAALSMGGPQIQNRATIGGNICNGAVSADSAPSLFALDARLVLQSAEKKREIPIPEFYLGPGRVDRKPDELLTEILIPPVEKHSGNVYNKFAVRKAMDLAILGVAAAVELDSDDRIRKAAIALGVAAPTPIRCPKAEAYLQGKVLGAGHDEDILAEVGKLALESACPRDSWRASKRYREALIRTLSGRAVKDAFIQATEK